MSTYIAIPYIATGLAIGILIALAFICRYIHTQTEYRRDNKSRASLEQVLATKHTYASLGLGSDADFAAKFPLLDAMNRDFKK